MKYPSDGGCLCGAIRYRLAAPRVASMHCHCDNCRKASGSGMLTWVTVTAPDFEWLAGEPKRYRYTSEYYPAPVERAFCGDCGSPLTWHCVDDGTIDVTAGSLDRPDAVEPQRHVFARSRLRWMRLEDDLPAFETTAREVTEDSAGTSS